MKAKQIQAQFNAQSRKQLRHSSAKRGWLTGLAAAAVLMLGTVTVGAVNNWDYSVVFNKYFSEKSGTQSGFDFTGMGLDIGDTIGGDGFSMTIQSVMADASNLYIAYDVVLSDEINAEIAPYDDALLYICLDGRIVSPDEEYPLNQGGASPMSVRDADGVWHAMDIIAMEFGTDLEGKQLHLGFPKNFDDDGNELYEYAPICIEYGFDEEGKDGVWKTLKAPEQIDLCYDLSGITLQPGTTAPYGGTLPNDANENIFDEMTVTPFMLRFKSSGHGYGVLAAPHWGMVWGDDRIDVSFAAVYEDGTEKALIPIGSGGGGGGSGGQASRNPEGGFDWELEKDYYFASPFPLDGLAAIRINDQVIPVA